MCPFSLSDHVPMMTGCLFGRLTVYPEIVKQADIWLDSTGGSSSVQAAVLRQADASGLARGSNWCPGLNKEEAQTEAPNILLRRDSNGHASTSSTGMPASDWC